MSPTIRNASQPLLTLNMLRIRPPWFAFPGPTENQAESTADSATMKRIVAGICCSNTSVSQPDNTAIGIVMTPSCRTGVRKATTPNADGIRNLNQTLIMRLRQQAQNLEHEAGADQGSVAGLVERWSNLDDVATN